MRLLSEICHNQETHFEIVYTNHSFLGKQRQMLGMQSQGWTSTDRV